VRQQREQARVREELLEGRDHAGAPQLEQARGEDVVPAQCKHAGGGGVAVAWRWRWRGGGVAVAVAWRRWRGGGVAVAMAVVVAGLAPRPGGPMYCLMSARSTKAASMAPCATRGAHA
jgi:hypothetical protein